MSNFQRAKAEKKKKRGGGGLIIYGYRLEDNSLDKWIVKVNKLTFAGLKLEQVINSYRYS